MKIATGGRCDMVVPFKNLVFGAVWLYLLHRLFVAMQQVF